MFSFVAVQVDESIDNVQTLRGKLPSLLASAKENSPAVDDSFRIFLYNTHQMYLFVVCPQSNRIFGGKSFCDC